MAWRSGQGKFFIRMIPTSYSMVHIVLYSYSKVLYESVTRTAKLSFNFPQASKQASSICSCKAEPARAREVRGVVRGEGEGEGERVVFSKGSKVRLSDFGLGWKSFRI